MGRLRRRIAANFLRLVKTSALAARTAGHSGLERIGRKTGWHPTAPLTLRFAQRIRHRRDVITKTPILSATAEPGAALF
jgi:hypothetical protein